MGLKSYEYGGNLANNTSIFIYIFFSSSDRWIFALLIIITERGLPNI